MPDSDLFTSGLELVRKMYGNDIGDLDLPLAEGDPARREWTAWLYGHLMQERGVLDVKTRSLLAVAMLTALGEEEVLEKWVGGAINLGCSRSEIREAIVTTSVYAGYPRTRRALKAACKAAGQLD